MRKDKSFVEAKSREVDLGSQCTDLQGEKNSQGKEGDRQRKQPNRYGRRRIQHFCYFG